VGSTEVALSAGSTSAALSAGAIGVAPEDGVLSTSRRTAARDFVKLRAVTPTKGAVSAGAAPSEGGSAAMKGASWADPTLSGDGSAASLLGRRRVRVRHQTPKHTRPRSIAHPATMRPIATPGSPDVRLLGADNELGNEGDDVAARDAGADREESVSRVTTEKDAEAGEDKEWAGQIGGTDHVDAGVFERLLNVGGDVAVGNPGLVFVGACWAVDVVPDKETEDVGSCGMLDI
jgi:hypothetical protein